MAGLFYKPETDIARKAQKAGRFGDKIPAHISPEEALLLLRRGGSGSINPKTGFMEFFSEGDGVAGTGQGDATGADGGTEGGADMGGPAVEVDTSVPNITQQDIGDVADDGIGDNGGAGIGGGPAGPTLGEQAVQAQNAVAQAIANQQAAASNVSVVAGQQEATTGVASSVSPAIAQAENEAAQAVANTGEAQANADAAIAALNAAVMQNIVDLTATDNPNVNQGHVSIGPVDTSIANIARSVLGQITTGPVSPAMAHSIAQAGGNAIASMMGGQGVAQQSANEAVSQMGSGGGVPAGAVSTGSVAGVTNDTNAGGSVTGGMGGDNGVAQPAGFMTDPIAQTTSQPKTTTQPKTNNSFNQFDVLQYALSLLKV